jgi:hypothetical protein
MPGTYRISARTAAGRVVRRITLVVIRGSGLSPAELRSLRAANTCAAATQSASTSATSGSFAGGSATPAQGLPRPQAPNLSSGLGAPPPDLNSGVLGASVAKTARAIRPALVALLAIAIVLLGLASLPRLAIVDERYNDLLARHRAEIASLGAVALVAVAISFLLS